MEPPCTPGWARGAAICAAVLSASLAPASAAPAELPGLLATASEEAGAVCQDASELAIGGDGRAVASPLLDAMAGFGRAAGTVGGLGRPVLTVTNAEDADPPGRQAPPAGGLRAAVETARRLGGAWIVFSPDLGPRPRIDLRDSPLRLPSNVTLDGGCNGVTLTAPPDKTILLALDRTENIVVARLRLEKRGEPGPDARGDCIGVGRQADRLWIAYNALRRCGDGAVDITQSRAAESPTRATVAFNRFSDHDKVMLVATLECQQPGPRPESCAAPVAAPWSWSRGVQVTLQGNVFLGTGQRHPRLEGIVYLHMLDNVVAFQPFRRTTGQEGVSYGVLVGRGARAWIENNLFLPLRPDRPGPAVSSLEAPGARIEAQRGGPGSAQGAGAVWPRGGVAFGGGAEPVPPPPPYGLRPERALDADPRRAALCAVALSGPGVLPRSPPPACAGAGGLHRSSPD